MKNEFGIAMKCIGLLEIASHHALDAINKIHFDKFDSKNKNNTNSYFDCKS